MGPRVALLVEQEPHIQRLKTCRKTHVRVSALVLYCVSSHSLSAVLLPYCLKDHWRLNINFVCYWLSRPQAETHHSSCENRGHTKVPRGFSADTSLLDLRGNSLHYIPSNSFPGVTQVVSLHLQRCKIVEVEEGAFSGMKGLIYLYLSENDLTSLSPNAFKGFWVLFEKGKLHFARFLFSKWLFISLYLSSKSVGLPQLTYLHLEKNRFVDFPKAAFKLVPSLLALHMENNAIARLEPDTITGAEGLRALYLTGNAIEHVSPRALEHAGDLDTLHLGGNKLKEVPTEALSKAGNIRDLRLSGNTIRWVGPNAFQPVGKSLKELYLDNMGLERVSRVYELLRAFCRNLSVKANVKVNLSRSRCRRTLWRVWDQDSGACSWRETVWRKCPTSNRLHLWRSSTWLTTLWCVTALCCRYACKKSSHIHPHMTSFTNLKNNP